MADTDTPDTRPSEPGSPPDWSRGEPTWQAPRPLRQPQPQQPQQPQSPPPKSDGD